jgi:PAS domain S-box-containing protein
MSSPSIRILAVDDEPEVCELTKLFLELSGEMIVDKASSVREGMDTLNKKRYDAIVSDYQMPVEDGIHFLRSLRAAGDKTPFILFTGRGREEIVIEALNIGADSYLQKGGDPQSQYAELGNRIALLVGRRRAEESLREKESHLSTLGKTIPDMIWLKDALGIYRSCNGTFEKFFGAQESDILGKTDYDFLSDQQANLYREEDHTAIAEGKPITNERWVTFKDDGHSAFLHVIKTPMLDADGKVVGVLGIGRDITERKRAEDSLRSSQHMLSNILRTSPSLIYIYDLKEDRNLYTNHEVIEFLGYSPEKILEMGSHLFENVMHPDDVKLVEDHQEKLRHAADGEIIEAEYRMKRANGTWCWLCSHDVIFERDSDGSVRSELGVAEDVTERKMMEESLKRSEEKYRQLVDSAAEAIVVVEDGLVRLVNRASLLITGFSERELTSRPFQEFIHPDDRVQVVRNYQGRLRGEAIRNRYDFRLCHKDGSTRWVEIGTVLIDWEGRAATLNFLTDITERKQGELDLRAAEAELRETHRLAHIGTWDWIAEGDAVTWSEELYRISGRDPKLLAPTFAELPQFYTTASWKLLSSAVQKATTIGEPYDLVLEMIRPDGDIRRTNAIGSVRRNSVGKVVGLHGLVQDITDRKRNPEE